MPGKTLSLSLFFVSLAAGIIMWLLPRKPMIIFVFLLVIFLLLFYPIWNLPFINKSLWLRAAALLFVASCICILGYIVYPNENLKPKLDIKIFSTIDPRYQSQLREYSLLINNLNPESMAIEDFRIEFIFKNIIERIKSRPLLHSGGDVSFGGITIYGKDEKGVESSYEDHPVESSITKNFSLEIQRGEINGKLVNTNILVFNCERWPAEAGYSARIIINLSKNYEIKIEGPTNQYYQGVYYYHLGGKRMSETVAGSIPPL